MFAMPSEERDPWTADEPPGPVAHTPNASGRWHPFDEHSRAVATLARAFAERLSVGEIAYWAGLLHDVGKLAPDFQNYLLACRRAEKAGRPQPRRGSVPHKQLGAALAGTRMASLLAPVLLGHHGGMPSRGETQTEVQRLSGRQLGEVAAAAHNVGLLPQQLPSLNPAVRGRCSNALEMEMLARMVFSCLADADALDTERHFERDTHARRARSQPVVSELAAMLLADQDRLQRDARPGTLNSLRRELFEACVQVSGCPPGVFKLTAPTGAGKTRSSLAFALEHACRHGLERVIYAIPYTSIVDQTAEVFEGVFGKDAVLEHHSALEPDSSDPARELWQRLASQNWDAPLIVTTTVQLFESVFGHRPGRCRKVHRLARSVIVLDEVQTLPVKILGPIVDGLRTLCEQYGATVLLCTATQPALDQEALERMGFAAAREIAPDPGRLFASLKRVEYDLVPVAGDTQWSWERAADEMRKEQACLAVVNTRRDAIALLDALSDDSALHLSTLLCGRHRRDTLREIQRRLKAGESCRVVSTQVVECGCDLNFPRVLRAIGPLDRIVQAAGRCNREGLLDCGRVTVFRPAGGGAPRGSYAVAMGVAARFLRGLPDLHDREVYERYFRDVFRQDSVDAFGVQRLREGLDFPTVAEKMRLIKEDTSGVLVRYGPAAGEIDQLLNEIRGRREGLTRQLWRRAQPFLVAIRTWELERFQKQALVREEAPDLWRWIGGYDPVKGLSGTAVEVGELIV